MSSENVVGDLPRMLACAMAEVVRVQCLVCKEYCSPQKRRKVQSPSTEHIVPILQELLPERVHVKLTTAYAAPVYLASEVLTSCSSL